MEFVKRLISSSQTKDIIFLLKQVDRKQKMRQAMGALRVPHVLLALSSVHMETMQALLEFCAKQLYRDNKMVTGAYLNIKKRMDSFGPGLISAAVNTNKNQLMQFLAADEEKKKASTVDDDWLVIPDPDGDALLSPEELAVKRQKEKIREAKMQAQLAQFMEVTEMFYEMTKLPEIERLIKEYNPEIFTNPDNWTKIQYFNKEAGTMDDVLDPANFEGCDQGDASQAYLHLLCMDQLREETYKETIEAKIKRGESVDNIAKFEPFAPKFWKGINNCHLVCKMIHGVTEENIQKLLDFICSLYDDFMAHKIDNVKKLPQMIIDKIKETTQFDGKSASTVGDFILEAIFHNCNTFREAFDKIKKQIPKELVELAKEKGYDLNQMNVDNLVQQNLQKLLDVRNKRHEAEIRGEPIEQDFISPIMNYFKPAEEKEPEGKKKKKNSSN